MATGDPGVAADVRTLVESHGEVVAVVGAGGLEFAAVGRGLRQVAGPGPRIFGAVCTRLATLAGVRRVVG